MHKIKHIDVKFKIGKLKALDTSIYAYRMRYSFLIFKNILFTKTNFSTVLPFVMKTNLIENIHILY